MNIENFNELIQYMREQMHNSCCTKQEPKTATVPRLEPDIFDMTFWYLTTPCGTCACIYGTILYLMYQEQLVTKEKLTSNQHHTFDDAAAWLGISEASAQSLFCPSDDKSLVHSMTSTKEEVVRVLEGIRDGRIVYDLTTVHRRPFTSVRTAAWHYALTETPS